MQYGCVMKIPSAFFLAFIALPAQLMAHMGPTYDCNPISCMSRTCMPIIGRFVCLGEKAKVGATSACFAKGSLKYYETGQLMSGTMERDRRFMFSSRNCSVIFGSHIIFHRNGTPMNGHAAGESWYIDLDGKRVAIYDRFQLHENGMVRFCFFKERRKTQPQAIRVRGTRYDYPEIRTPYALFYDDGSIKGLTLLEDASLFFNTGRHDVEKDTSVIFRRTGEVFALRSSKYNQKTSDNHYVSFSDYQKGVADFHGIFAYQLPKTITVRHKDVDILSGNSETVVFVRYADPAHKRIKSILFIDDLKVEINKKPIDCTAFEWYAVE